MPRKTRKPSYLLHKASGQARVVIRGKTHYLGEYGSPESWDEYHDLVAEYLANEGDLSTYLLTIDDLCLLFMRDAEDPTEGYWKNGKLTSEVAAFKSALMPLVELYGTLRVRDFSPSKLIAVRKKMIDLGWVRKVIDRQVGRVRKVFKWGVQRELVPGSVHSALTAVKPLKKGCPTVKESEKVGPVNREKVDAIHDHVPPAVWAMVQLQWLTGMRSGEVVIMRDCDITESDRVWTYVPRTHKNEHREKDRLIPLGPQAQAIIRDYRTRDAMECLFRPRGGSKGCTPASYRQAIRRGCERAFGMPAEIRNNDRIEETLKQYPASEQAAARKRLRAEAAAWRNKNCWHPHQLRHAAATRLRKECDLDTVRAVLGQQTLAMADTYADLDQAKAFKAMREFG